MCKPLKYWCIAMFATLQISAADAQTQLEFDAASYPSPPLGPSVASQSAQLLKNTTGATFVAYAPAITVSAAWSDQQYTSVTGITTGTGSCFGAQLNASAKTALAADIFDNLGSKSAPAAALFTSSPFGTAGTGIDTANNYGFTCFTTIEPLYASSSVTNARYYYSTLTLTFSRAVDNPVLHLAGLGGTEGTLGFSTEFELQTTGVTLNKLSGTGVFNVTANKILNSATSISAVSGSSAATTGAASGSVRVTGTGITTLAFKVYLRGDGNGSTWSKATEWGGDRWLLGVSMSTPVITGTIFHDANGLLGTPVNTIDGTGTNISGQLFANLVDGGGNVVLSSPVASDGIYTFQDLLPSAYPAQYSIILSDAEGTPGTAAPAPSLPSGWINTGEFLGTGAGNDGTENGILSGITIANASAVKSNANFGIEQLPNTTPKLKTYASNTPGTSYTVPSLTGTDPEEGVLGTGSTFMINTLPAGATLSYNAVAVTTGQTISNFTPALLTIDPLDGILSTSFTYGAIDAAGQGDQSPATFTLNWSITLPITLLDFTASKNQKTTSLKWVTGEQVNTGYMEVERSSDGVHFELLQRINVTPNSSMVNNYSFTDALPAAGKNYYRLKLVSINESVQYSQVKQVSFEATGTVLTYPNPVQSQLKITLSDSWIHQTVKIELFNQLGERVLSKQVSDAPQTQILDLNRLSAGSYILKLTQQDNTPVIRNIQVKR
ncbi:T9SS type A sorting domain-containing protein [Ferruginibacter paludis]|uniref:T9SS type A sorting domain-containing protein n=1 Tax=Ferruginibacter paludis TaxID=1310417 RepID=UPI0025B5C4BB|nr:T9SS type A sorting domain-containing protein [Ferruginibacter paludis]MDN3656511.1 T9SS type A sorting domain-containing protein [Ferruginibacter paludis]